MTILVTGGAGFIGSAVVRALIRQTAHRVVNADALTYAANLANLDEVAGEPRYSFERANIADNRAMVRLFRTFQPEAVIHLAAESHVDRSIAGPAAFIETNVVGTYTLLEAARQYWAGLPRSRQQAFRFLHVSTDEVFGSLEPHVTAAEDTPYAPGSPYSASKAGADMLVRAWAQTYGLPVLLTHCSNNYGPYQHPEKLIPTVILSALERAPVPIYGAGDQVRDWLYVDDHVDALLRILERGRPGQSYNIGGDAERTNFEIARSLCRLVDARTRDGFHHESLIEFVEDRPGHDQRYAIDARKITKELGWRPKMALDDGLAATVDWYLGHRHWWVAARQPKDAHETVWRPRAGGAGA